MSGLEYLLSKTLTNQTEPIKPESPSDIQSALSEFLGFCDKQLPKTLVTDFSPVCFDITKDELSLVIGGIHGNVAVYDIKNNKAVQDKEEYGFHSIVNILLALADTQVVACTAKSEIFILDFPSLKKLHNIDLGYSPVELIENSGFFIKPMLKLGSDEEWLYYSRFSNAVEVLKLGNSKNFYTKKLESATIDTDEKVLCLDVCDDGTLIAVGMLNGDISLIHADTLKKLQTTNEAEKRPLILTFSEKRKHLAAGFDDNTLKVWNLDNNLSLIYEFNRHSDIVSGIAFVRNNRYMVTSSYDTSLIIWDLKVESNPFIMNLYEGKIAYFKISSDHKTVYYSQTHNAIMAWTIPTLHKNARYRKHEGKLTKVLFLPNSFELLSIGEDGLAVIWDFRNDLMQEAAQLEGSLINATISSDGQFVMILSTKPCIYRWDLSTGCTDEYEFKSAGLAVAFSSDDYMLAVSDSLCRVITYDADVMAQKFAFKGHRANVTGLAFIDSNNFLLSASLDNEIFKWDLMTGEKIMAFRGHQNSIHHMIASNDGWVISASDEAIIIWNYDGVLFYKMGNFEEDPGRNKGLYFSNDGSYLISLQEHRLTFWQIDNLSIVFQIDTVYSGNSVAVSPDEKFISVAEGNTVFIEENPMCASQLRIVGKNQGSQHKYMKFVQDSQKENSNVAYDESHNHWVLVPYVLGISHILAYTNRIDDLNHALFESENKAGYFSTLNQENPLTICVELEFKNVIDVCLKFMKAELQKGNIRAFASIEKCLTKLNTIEYPDISRVYDILFKKAEGIHLPDFCLHETELPQLHTSQSIVIIPEEIVGKEFFSSTGRPVVFHHSLCLLDTELGTTASLEFLESLLNGDKEVYNSRIVKEFLQSKWDKIVMAVNVQGCIYITYMILLSLYTVSYIDSDFALYLVIFVHLVLFSIEILQLVTDYRNYFYDVWNIFDQLRTWSFHWYVFTYFFLDEGNHKSYNELLAVTIFSWLRGISYFRMFEGTRYMVRLLGMVIMDMRIFFTILAYSTVGFAFIYYLRHPETPFPMYLTTSYRLDLGDFNTDFTEVFDWLVFFLNTMMNPMIMLNLLISILSDTAAKVAADNYVANLQELTRMIIEIERVMFWKKNVVQKDYLHLCCFIEDEPDTDPVLAKCKFIKKKMVKLQGKLDIVNQQIASVNVGVIDSSIKSMIQQQQEIKEEMNRRFEESNQMLLKIEGKLGN